MIQGRRDFRTRISSSIDSLPPGTCKAPWGSRIQWSIAKLRLTHQDACFNAACSPAQLQVFLFPWSCSLWHLWRLHSSNLLERTNYGDADVESQSLWIAPRACSFQLHNQLLGFLVIAKDVQQGMIHGRRDFRTRISCSIDSLPPGTSAGKRNRLLMRHLLPDDVQLHSSLLLKSGFLLGKQCQYSLFFFVLVPEVFDAGIENLRLMEPLWHWDLASLCALSGNPNPNVWDDTVLVLFELKKGHTMPCTPSCIVLHQQRVSSCWWTLSTSSMLRTKLCYQPKSDQRLLGIRQGWQNVVYRDWAMHHSW